MFRRKSKTSHQYTATNIVQKEEQDQPPVYSNQYYAEEENKTSHQYTATNIMQKEEQEQPAVYSNLSYCALPLAMFPENKDSDGPRLNHRELTLYSGAAHSLRLP